MLCSSSGNHRDPHSFPTRRSSDLIRLMIGAQVKDFRDRGVTIAEMEKEFKCCYVPITGGGVAAHIAGDRKSTRLNSSHRCISYAVFCLKKKKNPVTHKWETISTRL